jgi:hypothetical protein
MRQAGGLPPQAAISGRFRMPPQTQAGKNSETTRKPASGNFLHVDRSSVPIRGGREKIEALQRVQDRRNARLGFSIL